MLRPASRPGAGPGRTASASRGLLWVQPAHGPAAGGAPSRRCPHRVLPLECARPWPVLVRAGGPGQARSGQSDSDGSDAPACGPCWPGPVPGGGPDPVRATRTLRRERGRHRIRRSHPTSICIWPIGPPCENTLTPTMVGVCSWLHGELASCCESTIRQPPAPEHYWGGRVRGKQCSACCAINYKIWMAVNQLSGVSECAGGGSR